MRPAACAYRGRSEREADDGVPLEGMAGHEHPWSDGVLEWWADSGESAPSDATLIAPPPDGDASVAALPALLACWLVNLPGSRPAVNRPSRRRHWSGLEPKNA